MLNLAEPNKKNLIKKILQIDKFLDSSGAIAGGVGRYVSTLGDALREKGHDVLAFGCGESGQASNMPEYFDFTATRSPLALLRMIHNSQAADKLDAFLRANPVDVAHVHNIYHHLTPSIFPVLARHGVGIVMTVHDYRLACPTKFFLRKDGLCTRCLGNKFWHAASRRCAGLGGAGLAIESYWNFLLRRYSRYIDTFFCPTEYMCGVLRACRYPANKIVHLPNPVIFQSAEPPAAPSDGYVLMAGRISPEKSPETMLSLAAKLPETKIVIAGGGPALDSLQKQLEQTKLKNVKLLGHVRPEDMPKIYAGAAAVVITSRWIENSPAVMLEAMAAGRVVIGPNHPPLQEWIKDGSTGRIFVLNNSQNVESLSDVVRQVLADPAAAREMADKGRELVLARHDTDKIVSQIEEFYERSMQRCELR